MFVTIVFHRHRVLEHIHNDMDALGWTVKEHDFAENCKPNSTFAGGIMLHTDVNRKDKELER